MALSGGSTNPDSPAAKTVALSSERAAAVGAFKIERLGEDGFVLCIRKGSRTIAIAGIEATQNELLGMAAAPALARALAGLLKDDLNHNDMTDAVAFARKALFSAGVTLK